jgi:hypothetical protein
MLSGSTINDRGSIARSELSRRTRMAMETPLYRSLILGCSDEADQDMGTPRPWVASNSGGTPAA